jgi:hypothetical protein
MRVRHENAGPEKEETPSISNSNPRFHAYRHSQGHRNTSDLLVYQNLQWNKRAYI